MMGTRNRFIAFATLGYAAFALLWIFFSDQLLWALVGSSAIVWLSTAKGFFFVLVTAVIWFFLLRAVPSAQENVRLNALDRLTSSLYPQRIPAWAAYSFAVLIALAALLLREAIGVSFEERPLLIVFTLPIILSALLGGLGPGLLCTLVAALGVNILAIPPTHSMNIASTLDLIQWIFLIFNGAVVSVLSEVLRSSLQKIATSHNLLEAVVNGTSDAIFLKDSYGKYLMLNDAAMNFISRRREDVIGQDDTKVFPENAERIMRIDREVMQANALRTAEETLTNAEGGMLNVHVTKGPIKDKQGVVIGVFGVARDISAWKTAEAALEKERSFLKTLIRSLPDLVWMKDPQGVYIACNSRFEQYIGISEENILGKTDADLLPADVAEDYRQEDLACMLDTQLRTIEQQVVFAVDGHREWLETIKAPIFDKQGNLIGVLGIGRDITERRRSESQLRILTQAVEQSPESVVITDVDGVVQYVNESFVRVSGYSRQEILGQNPRMLASGRTPQENYQSMWQALLRGETWRGEFFNRRKDGSEYVELAVVMPVRQANGVITHYASLKEDVTDKKKAAEEINRLAYYDPITSLPNRMLLMDRLGLAVAVALRQQHMDALILLNIDRFKVLNDAHGRALGDEVLKAVGQRLRDILREGDTIARLSGDEFAIVLQGVGANADSAVLRTLTVAEKLQSGISIPFALERADEVRLTASLGITLYPQNGQDLPQEILRRADTALHRAKEAGGNQTSFFENRMDDVARERVAVERELRRAIPGQELRIFLQAQIDAFGCFVGAEVLVRWQHPKRGLLPPGVFIGIAEETDLIVDLGNWVLREACELMARESVGGVPLRLSVNLSPRQFRQANFVPWLKALIEQSGADPTLLTLEVTEGLMIDNLDSVAAKMSELVAMGVHFSVDDFGTGYSALSYLRRLPIHELKIDKSFIQDIPQDPNAVALVETILSVARHLGLRVVAEGVETAQQSVYLNELGELGQIVHQGYFYGKPEPVVDFLNKWRNGL